jgi:hypothetical protein
MPPESDDLTEQDFADEPVTGDGVITVPPFERETKMPAVDLPESVASQLLTESVGNIQANNRDGRNAGTVATNVLTGAMARNFDELGTVESRAHSGIMGTNIGTPSNQG